MILRELAAGWVQANCPRSDVQENFLQYLDDAMESRVNSSFMIGRKLIGSGKPFWVWCFRGEVFAFELTPQQAARLQVADSLVVCARECASTANDRHAGLFHLRLMANVPRPADSGFRFRAVLS